MRQKKERREKPEVSKYAMKRMEAIKSGRLPVTGKDAPPPFVINREAKAYLREQGQ